MKLNNKGFAITGILYGLLLLFVLLVGSYLTVLSSKKNRLDSVIEDAEDEYFNEKVPVCSNNEIEIDDRTEYVIPCDGNYKIKLDSQNYGQVDCDINLNSGDTLVFDSGSIKIGTNVVEFEDSNCDMANAFNNFIEWRTITFLV